jgi:aminocarboxymuconate-semialdehyde decarboxylase
VTAALAALATDELADLCARYADRFLGFAASVSLDDPDGALREIERACGSLGALGTQIFTNVNGRPLDEARFAPVFAKMADLDRAVWVHPARGATHPDYVVEDPGGLHPGRRPAAVGRGLRKRPFEYYRMFYGDTALFGPEHALRCAIEFFGVDHMLFGSDMPFDPEKGPQFIRETIANLEAIDLPEADRRSIYEGNARRVLRIAPA